MLAIIDYGLGNAQAFHDIYHRLGVPVTMARLPPDLDAAQRIILPGVGAFDWAMARLESSGLRGALEAAVLGRGVPVLGICVGMQILADGSEEGTRPGLGWIPGMVRRFAVPVSPGEARLPHMGWNDVSPREGRSALFAGLPDPSRFYFLHSYYFAPSDPAYVTATTHHVTSFASAVSRDHIHGVQFHPEKSHGQGVTLLRDFAGS